MSMFSERIAKLSPKRLALLAMELQSQLEAMEQSQTEPIAIIGMGCRLPGDASTPEAFWQLLRDGVDAISEVPAGRWDVEAFYDPDPETPGKMYTQWGGFLQEVATFDAHFFGIAPREVVSMDPQQRLLLEVSWEALESAGQVLDRLAGSKTGVYMGVCTNDYARRHMTSGDPTRIDAYAGTGAALSVAIGRISYLLGLQGPNIAVDTACSSALVAVHLACKSLRTGECDLALAGGVNLILSPENTIYFCKVRAMAADGRCKTFDAAADGYVRGEGCGVVVLKRLSDAVADGDQILALIRGSAINQDGRSNGLTAPNGLAQQAVIQAALASAGVEPAHVSYVEAHGTGTSLGDPIEVRSLATVLCKVRAPDQRLMLGSVKTNIGHLEAAAGVAGLIKVVLALQHEELPPHLHLHELNPHVAWDELPVVIPTARMPWPPGNSPRIAGVSSFGFSGTNAHVIVEEATQQTEAEHIADDPRTSPAYLLPLSARSLAALQALARAYQDFLSDVHSGSQGALANVCYTTSLRRSHHEHRLALVGHTRAELCEHLEAFLAGELRPGMSSGCTIPEYQRKLVFVFPGQGAQWLGMGRQLLAQEPVFRDALEQCAQVLQPHVAWSLLEELTADPSRSRLHEVDVIQPALFAIQVALAALWRSWGVEPSAVVGQSMGEVAAAYVAGALSLEDAACVICRRSQLVKSTSGQGGMAVVGLALDAAQRALSGYEDRVLVAVSSSPSSTVVSGDLAALQDILEHLARQDIFCSLVKVDYASHSPYMEPLRPTLLRALEGLQPRSASLPIYSTVTGEISDGRELDAAYWARNLREPVLFLTTCERLLQAGHDIFLEISPHPIVVSAIQQGLRHFGYEGVALPSLRREEEERAVMLGSLGVLYTLGHPIDWRKLYPAGGRCVQLPSYPWQRERFWLEDSATSDVGIRQPFLTRSNGSSPSGGPFLHQSLQSAIHTGTRFWEMELSTSVFPYLADHRVQGTAVLPAAAYVEIALSAATEVFGPGAHTLEEVLFKKALFLPENSAQIVQLVVSPAMLDTLSLQFFSRDTQDSWTLHATGTIRRNRTDVSTSAAALLSPRETQARCPEVISSTEHYQAMQERGLQYGPAFQGVEQIWRRDGEAIGRLHLPETITSCTATYQIHPACLDACFQVLLATLPREGLHIGDEDTYLPIGLESVRLYTRPCFYTGLWSYTRLQLDARVPADTLKGDVILLDEEGHVVLEALGLRVQRLERHRQQHLDDWLYEIQWQPKEYLLSEQAPEPLPQGQQGRWLIFADNDGLGQTLGDLLEERGETCVFISPGETYQCLELGRYQLHPAQPEEFQQLLTSAFGDDQPPCRGIVHLWGLEPTLEEATSASLETTQTLGCFSVLHLVQALVKTGQTALPRLWLVTRGVQAVGADIAPVSVAQAPLWGLGRVIANEHPELRCTLVDLNSARQPEEVRALAQELWSDDHENQIAWRDGRRYVARLIRSTSASSRGRSRKRTKIAGDQPFRLEISTPGILENLTLRATTRQVPGPGEVEIQVGAAGLNFRDVMIALGLYPGLPDGPIPLGNECAGRITALGEGVGEFQLGDEVVAIAPCGFGTYATTTAGLVFPKPAHLSFEEAATIPIAFLTAYYALHYLGKLYEGERVLIHAASGGVGLAAVQLAQRVGAEIFATAGSPEKREFLRSLGVQHVMDSRSLAFADEVMAYTDGQGVDVVLNSLAGEAIAKGLAILRPYGRFLEIGKRDIYQNSQLGLQPFQKDLAFFSIDLDRAGRERPGLIGTLMREVMQYFEDGSLKPLPVQTFPISEAESAFRYMAQAKHIGKIVVSLQDPEVLVTASSEFSARLAADGTYLITGGLGGLGLSVAQWMVEQGARHLVLMGRSAPSAAAEEVLDTMRKAGAQVLVARADVSQTQQVAGVVAEIAQSMPPLRGIIHAAGILDDGLLLHLDQERFKSVMAPKISGAWNLHTLTLDAPLDFFVLFSSAASLFGSPGQGNYVAANAFLDALAQHRCAQGRPALSINWGPWSEVGLAAAQSNRGERLVFRGFESITPRQGVDALEQLLRQDCIQVGVMPFNVHQWRAFYPAAAASPLLAQLMGEDEVLMEAGYLSEKSWLSRNLLLAMEPDEREKSLELYLEEQLARVLGLPASTLSKLDVHRPLNRLGIDSLMVVELKNRIEVDLSVDIPVVKFLQGITLTDLTAFLLAQLTGEISPASTLVASPAQHSEEHADSLFLSLRRLLAEEQYEE